MSHERIWGLLSLRCTNFLSIIIIIINVCHFAQLAKLIVCLFTERLTTCDTTRWHLYWTTSTWWRCTRSSLNSITTALYWSSPHTDHLMSSSRNTRHVYSVILPMSASVSQLPKLCVKISILRHKRMWVRSFSTRLTSATFAEDKCSFFLFSVKMLK